MIAVLNVKPVNAVVDTIHGYTVQLKNFFMNFSYDGSLMQLPLGSIGLSDEFTGKALQHGYRTLEEIINIPLTDLLKMEWFTHDMFDELSKVIRREERTARGK